MQVPTAFRTLRVPPCSLGLIKDTPETCKVCGNSTFSLNPANTSCDPCPSGAQCFGSDAFIPPAQHWHSSPNSTNIVSCPNPGACAGNRTQLLACKQVSGDFITMHSAFHVWWLQLCMHDAIALHMYRRCDIGNPYVIHSLYCTRRCLHGSHALLVPQHGAVSVCMHPSGAHGLVGTFTKAGSVGMTATSYLHPRLAGLSNALM